MCSLANCNLFIFLQWVFGGLLADSLASHRHLLTVTVLTGNFKLSLITLELIIGWVFAILAILRSIRMVVFRFLPHLSSFGCHFKAFDIILAEQPIIFCTSLYVFPSLINFLIKVRYYFEQCLERHIFKNWFDASFFTEWFTCPIKPHTAIMLNTPFSINDSITQNQQHGRHDCWICWVSITLPCQLAKYLPCRNIISTKNSDWSF